MLNNSKNIYNLLKHVALLHPKKAAIYTERGKITYEKLLSFTDKIASYLQQHIKAGDNIGIFMENSWQYIVATYAISAVGAVFVPINAALKSKELSYILSDANIEFMFCSDTLKDTVFKSIAIHQCNTIVWVGDENNRRDFVKILEKNISFTPKKVDLNDNAAIFYTSGTTGTPKGAILSNKNLLSSYNAFISHIKLRKSDRTALYLPMHLSFSLLPLAIIPLCYGSSIVLTRFISAENLLKTFALKRVTILFATPSIHTMLLKVPNTLLMNLFCKIRIVVSGGSSISVDIATKIQEKYKKAIFFEAYGLVEASTIVTANPIDRVKIGSVGVPLLDYKIKIIDSYDLELPKSVIGEIIIKGDNIMKSYLNSSIGNPCSVNNGWLYTGDLGYLDNDGYLYITGRKKDLIIYNFIHIYPSEIEPIIESFDGVKEVAVVAKKDKINNEIPVAFIVKEEDKSLNIDNLRKYLNGFLAKAKIPKEFIVIDELPRNASGKVLKRVLREMANDKNEHLSVDK